jgi:protein SCO1/2
MTIAIDFQRARAWGARSLVAGLALVTLTAISSAGDEPVTQAQILEKVTFDQKLENQVPLDLKFRDETGCLVALGDLLHGKPVVLTLVYYECPMLCTQVLNGLVRALQPLDLKPGEDFELWTVSINPQETSELAAKKKHGYLRMLDKPEYGDHWHYLVGDQAAISALADSVGFRYVYDENLKEYAHPAGLVVLTPQAKVSRYLFDIDFSTRDLSFALMDSASGKIGSILQQVIFRCYHYDPMTGKYGFVISNVIRVLGFLTVAALGGFMFVTLRRERRQARLQARA